MTIKNSQIAAIFYKMTDLLEIEGANAFRVRAYRGAAVNIERGAKEHGCYLEINAHPERLDLYDSTARLAKDAGVKIAISTDAHSVRELHMMRYGIDQARRGWLGPDDVLNTRSWPVLKARLRSSESHAAKQTRTIERND